MLTTETAVLNQARILHDFHVDERIKLDRIRTYWKGLQGLPLVVPASAPREVREMARISQVNVLEIVVESLTQSLFVEGLRLPRQEGNLEPWAAWQRNRMDARQSMVHRPALAYGTGYTVVTPGNTAPLIRCRSPRNLLALYGEDPDWPMWALERWGGGWRMYDDEAVYFLSGKDGQFSYVEAREHGMGECPVARYVDTYDDDVDEDVTESIVVGQVAPLMNLQDQINLCSFGLQVAAHYGAFKQRYILGWIADTEEKKMKAAASQMWTFKDHPDDVRIGELTETELGGYIKSRESLVRYAATLSQTPVHELIGEMVNLSAEALAAAEAGRDRKVGERKTNFGESHEQTFWLAARTMGLDVPYDAEVVWRDTSARAFGAVVDGLGKLVQMLGIPPEELWERIPGATQQDVQRWKAAAAQGDSLAMLRDLFDSQAAPLEGEPVQAA